MLSKKELEEIKNHLEKAQNPLFFFDNDADGLCSYLLLRRSIQRGKGVAIKTFPKLEKTYLRKINELNPDYVFILDKNDVEKEFVDEVSKRNIPIVWIDHHDVKIDPEILKKVNYYNSIPEAEPVTYLTYKIYENKKDQWIAMIGCISDVYKPEFAKEFAKEYPELYNSKNTAFDSLYTTELGKIIKMINFGMKDTITNVVKMMKYLSKAKSPQDILAENYYTRQMHQRYSQLNQIYNRILEKAEEKAEEYEKLTFFEYSGNTSMTSEVANGIYFKNKEKLVIVAFKNQSKANISIRGNNAREILLKVLKKIPDSTGGGHETACGAKIPLEEIENFKEEIKKELKEI